MYDYLVVGSGLFGSVFARQAADAGKKVFVIDKRPNIAGNVYTEKVEGINFHKYGAHIFHTLSKRMGIIWMRNVALKAVPIRVLFIKYIVHS